MILIILRALFILLMVAAGFFFLLEGNKPTDNIDVFVFLMPAVAVSALLVSIDILSPRRKLAIFSGALFGMVVGLLIAYVLSFVVTLLVQQYGTGDKAKTIAYINMLVSITAVYLSISFIFQTKDDFRFIIPYVEFRKQTKGSRAVLLDTSVLIDGRIGDVASTGILDTQLVVPQFVIDELRLVADSADKLKRARGRRGLDVLQKLRDDPHLDVQLYEPTGRAVAEATGVDQKLMELAKELNARVMTGDFNLNKVAQLRGVDVINLNDVANALKPAVLPGEKLSVRLVKPGEEAGQGVGYLEDGTMVVVEGGRSHINEEVVFTITNTRQTSAGKMIFGRIGEGVPGRAA
jgi:uncharacterized protein YacL